MRRVAAMVLFGLWAPAAAYGQADVKINEFMPDPVGSDTGKEWIELYNAGDATQPLMGWRLRTVTTSPTTQVTFAAGVEIDPGEFLLVCAGAADCPGVPDVEDAMSLPHTTSAALYLDNGATRVDTVVYGGLNANHHLEDDLVEPVSGVPTAPEGVSIARKADGADTQVSAEDFWLALTASPDATNPPPPACETSSALTINEFLPDPAGTDSSVLLEWVELHNSGAAVDLTGWQIQTATAAGNYSLAVTIPSGTIATDGLFLIGETNVGGADFTTARIDLGSGLRGDGVRLVDCNGMRVDTAVYGPFDNEDDVHDDSEAPATSVAAQPGSNQSAARREDGVDTDLSGADFWIPTATTPGAPNPSPPTCETSFSITINEFLPDPSGTDSAVLLEWVELYNSGGTAVDLSGWRIYSAGSADNYSLKATIPSGAIAPGGYFVVGEANITADYTSPTPLALGSGTGGDGVQLVDCAGEIMDTVVYGPDNDQGVYDDSGGPATSIAGDPTSDESVARRVDGFDTDLCGDDFFVTTDITPGATNADPPVCELEAGWIVINELLPNPAGTDSGFEWVELYNAHATDALALDDWRITTQTSAGSTGNWSTKLTFPANTDIEPGGFVLVGEDQVPDVDFTSTLSMGNGSGGDGVRLYDCEGTVADTVVYGDPKNEDEISDDSLSIATSIAAMPGDGAALARKADGLDTDLSGEDFTLSNDPTPGASNPVYECFPDTGAVKLNELLSNPSGTDAEAATEFVELYNTGEAAVRLDGWQLVLASNGDDTAVDVIIPPASSIGGQGFFVIGNAEVLATDFEALFAVGNGSNGDAVILLDCEGTRVDTAVYGSNNDDLNLDDTGALADPSPAPGDDQSLARRDDGVDTDDRADWFVDGSPTPGATNFQEIIDVPDEGGGCGRGKVPEGGDPTGCGSGEPREGGCTTAPLPFGGLELVVGLIALLRRRERR